MVTSRMVTLVDNLENNLNRWAKVYTAKEIMQNYPLNRAFRKAGAMLWNDLPGHMRNIPTLSGFKRALKTGV